MRFFKLCDYKPLGGEFGLKTDRWEKLIKIVTRSYAPFLIYSAVFITLIVFLMSVIKIDSYRVYECTTDDRYENFILNEYVFLEDADYLYIYVNKSDEFIRLNTEDVRLENGTTLIFLDDGIKTFVKKNGCTKYYVEVPVTSSIMKSIFDDIK